jgi:hypothetical protein
VTAETIPDIALRDVFGELVTFPSRERTLVELKVRAGDFATARKVAATIDDRYHGGYQKGHAYHVIACAQAEAKAALETAAEIQHDFHKADALTDIARIQAQAGDHAGAAKTIAKALQLADAVPEVNTTLVDYARPLALRRLAAAQAEVGQEQAAREWIGKQEPHLRVWALLGLVEGTAERLCSKNTSEKHRGARE